MLDLKLQGELSYRLNDHIEVKGLAMVRHAVTKSSHFIAEASNVVQAFRANETPYVARENIYLLKNKDDPMQLPGVALTHGGYSIRRKLPCEAIWDVWLWIITGN